MNMSNYFDLKQVWVNELVGDIWLFFFIGLICLWLFASKAKIPFQVTLTLSVLWVGLCFTAASSTFTVVWAVMLMGVGFVFYYGIAKLLK